MKTLSPLVFFPSLKLVLQGIALTGYGVFRDELYYVACSERLAAGYVDHPPLSIFLLRLIREVFGEGIWPMRAVSALLGAAVVLMVGLLARRLGGGAVAQSLAMAGFLAAPVQWFVGHYYSMNGFDALFWALAAYLLIEALQGGESKSWALLGLVLGLGLLNKISVLWLGLGIAAGLLLTG